MSDSTGDRLLDEMVGGHPLSPAAPSPEPEAKVARLRYRHEALIDLMIAKPHLTQNEWAAEMGYTPSWLSTIIASDAFQAALAERREQILDPVLRMTLKEQFSGILNRSLEIIRQKLDGTPENIEGQFALRTMEISSRALGYGARPPDAPKQGDLHIHLESLGDNLVAVLRKKKAEVIDGEVENGSSRSLESQG
jgi:hypothetical protein